MQRAAQSSQPARAVGLNDRGQLSVGYRADINVIDWAGCAAAGE